MIGVSDAAEDSRRLAALDRNGGVYAAAARELKLHPNTLREWHVRQKARAMAEGTAELAEQPPPIIYRPNYRISQDRVDGRGKVRVLAIGDAHDGPTIPKDRFRWMGQHANETRPDLIVQIGDFLSLDSLCRYEPNDTLKGKQKPSLKQDLASFRLALDAFNEGLGDFRPEKHECCGNHEDRMWSFVNRTPEMADLLDDNVHTLLTDAGWNYSPYGELHFVGGVAFTHVPLNTMGKPYGGMYAENQVARDATHDVVYGHSHKRVDRTFPKLGHKKITVVNLGCALPEGHIEQYAKHALTGWSWGIYELEIERGGIQATRWTSMVQLQEKYGGG